MVAAIRRRGGGTAISVPVRYLDDHDGCRLMALTFSPESERTIEDILKRYPADQRQAALIPVLNVAQDEFGYLTVEAMTLVAERLGLPPSQVLNTATFYTMLRKAPVGAHHVQVCTNVSCWLRGSDDLVRHIEKRLGIARGETTADKRFTLEEVQCLGACGTAPVMQVNDDYHEEMTPEKVDALLDTLAARGSEGRREP